jgi:hypothetical protein
MRQGYQGRGVPSTSDLTPLLSPVNERLDPFTFPYRGEQYGDGVRVKTEVAA